MELKPLGDHRCVMCNGPFGRMPEHVGMRYCEDTCVPNGRNGFDNVRSQGDQPTPHIHRTCKQCGYEWLAETYDGPSTT
jgi:hypothetical protein